MVGHCKSPTTTQRKPEPMGQDGFRPVDSSGRARSILVRIGDEQRRQSKGLVYRAIENSGYTR